MILKDEIYLTYDDVLLVPQYSEILPSEALLKSKFSKNIELNIPLASSAMDTVTESRTAITMALEGGIGVIHKNLSPEAQAREVSLVKKHVAGVLSDPITVFENDTLLDLKKIIARQGYSSFPVLNDKGDLVGIITNRDMRFETDMNKKVKEMMTPKERLVTGKDGISSDEVKKIFHQKRIEKLPIVHSLSGALLGLVTMKDIEKTKAYPFSNKDSEGRLRCAAAVGVGEKELLRAKLLIEAGVDAIVVDTAHGHSKGVLEMVKALKNFPDKEKFDVIAGNVATEEACLALIKSGVDGIKVGIGPGSICTTRVVAGIGVPQFQALLDCKNICGKENIPFIADGGIKYSGDIVKALAAGASTVMIGSLFAGTDEAPGERIIYQGRAYKAYRGMGSMGAMVLGSKDRYGQGSIHEESKLVPEGIEGQVPYRGPLSENIYQLLGGLRSGMGYVGAKDLEDLKKKAKFIKITQASLSEGHPHDIQITKEAPNYRLS